MKKVKTKRKYISGILMLLSATIVFFPLVSIGGIEISIKSAIQSVYSGYGSSGAATGLIQINMMKMCLHYTVVM